MDYCVDRKLILIPLGGYLIWVLSTYMLEGRISLLQKPNPVDRLTYAIITNILIGTVLTFWLLRPSIKSKISSLNQLGFRNLKRTLIAASVAALLGFLLLAVQQPLSLNQIAIFIVFAQTFPTSIAEVLVCWVLVGASVQSLLFKRMNMNYNYKAKKIISIILAATVATILFGTYHFAHSAPFNQPSMVLFLMVPGILTSIVYFVGRDVYSTIIFHNLQASYGVMASTNNMEQFLQAFYPIIILGIASIFVLIISDIFIVRRVIRRRPAENVSDVGQKP